VTREDDLALARRCAAGDEEAWERFVLEYRPILYRAADALDPAGRAREIADSLYAELYGTEERGGERRSLLRYFQGRSSLATWLRAVLAQRFVDRIRADRRLKPLPDEPDEPAMAAPVSREPVVDEHAARLRGAFSSAMARLSARERLRLGCYYQQNLTLAETGRIMKEHEATVSRQLAQTRQAIRRAIENELGASGLGADEIRAAFAAASEDSGTLDLEELLGTAERKKSTHDRSKG